MKKIIFTLLFFVSISAYSQDNSLTVIANKDGAPAALSFADLQNIFLGKQPKWSNGDKVTIALMKLTTDAGKWTCDKLYHLTPDQVTKHWLTLSIKGTIDAPVFFNTAAELQNFVSANRGAIGVMSGAASAPNTKTVLIDGKKTF